MYYPSTRSYLSQGFHGFLCGIAIAHIEHEEQMEIDSSQRLTWTSIRVSRKRPLTLKSQSLSYSWDQLHKEQQPQALNLTIVNPHRFTLCPLPSATTKVAARIFPSTLWILYTLPQYRTNKNILKSKSLLTHLGIMNYKDFCFWQLLLWSLRKSIWQR